MIFKDLLINLGQTIIGSLADGSAHKPQSPEEKRKWKETEKRLEEYEKRKYKSEWRWSLAKAVDKFAFCMLIVGMGGFILLIMWGLYQVAAWLDDTILHWVVSCLGSGDCSLY